MVGCNSEISMDAADKVDVSAASGGPREKNPSGVFQNLGKSPAKCSHSLFSISG